MPLILARMDGRAPDDPLFAAHGGGLISESNWRRAVDWTTEVGHRPHDLRHTAASLFIAAGADLKSVQSLLGHQSSRTTHDTYGHLLFADHLTSAVRRLDTMIGDESGTSAEQTDADGDD